MGNRDSVGELVREGDKLLGELRVLVAKGVTRDLRGARGTGDVAFQSEPHSVILETKVKELEEALARAQETEKDLEKALQASRVLERALEESQERNQALQKALEASQKQARASEIRIQELQDSGQRVLGSTQDVAAGGGAVNGAAGVSSRRKPPPPSS
uniref:Uncharacterized protein n=1 Tax=Hemiselmis andersenii TaxID=464988 RepID=A0A7S1MYS6_HEMAN|mmetsp:Transcript_9155/g.22458  ORF Transcript_9155/g.22458 Transcript_9155/m.22458 type:complete len:158 (+) Transcript_9155:3-476(+)